MVGKSLLGRVEVSIYTHICLNYEPVACWHRFQTPPRIGCAVSFLVPLLCDVGRAGLSLVEGHLDVDHASMSAYWQCNFMPSLGREPASACLVCWLHRHCFPTAAPATRRAIPPSSLSRLALGFSLPEEIDLSRELKPTTLPIAHRMGELRLTLRDTAMGYLSVSRRVSAS